MTRLPAAITLLLVIAAPSTYAAGSEVRHPFPQHTQYRGASLLPNHRTQDQLDDDARTLYDNWKSRYLS